MTEGEMRREDAPPAGADSQRPTPLLRPFAAGVAGAVWSAAVQFVATPLYLRFLGVEAYGLIGFYLTLQAVLTVFDLGVSVTVSREIARLATASDARELRKLVRTFEALYWAIAVTLAASIIAASGTIVRVWLRSATLPPDELRRTIVFMAFLWAFQWLVSFYQAALIGFEKLVTISVIRIVAMTALHLGAVVFLWRVSRDPAALFAYQTIVSVVHCAVIAGFLWAVVPAMPGRVRPSIDVLKSRWRFAIGMAGITVCGTLLAQTDKVVVSHLLPLRKFGFYSLAAVVATALYIAVIPVFNTILPRFSSLIARGDRDGVMALYRSSCQGIAILCAVPAGLIVFFGHDIILIWTGLPEVAREAAPIAAWLIVGSALNGMMNPPYALQLASGASGLGLAITGAQLLLYVPAVVVLTSRYGALGAAWSWALTNVLYVAVAVPITHRRFLGTSGVEWIRDVAAPFAAAFGLIAIAALVPTATTGLWRLLFIAAAGLAATAAAAAAAPRVRATIVGTLRRWSP